MISPTILHECIVDLINITLPLNCNRTRTVYKTNLISSIHRHPLYLILFVGKVFICPTVYGQ